MQRFMRKAALDPAACARHLCAVSRCLRAGVVSPPPCAGSLPLAAADQAAADLRQPQPQPQPQQECNTRRRQRHDSPRLYTFQQVSLEPVAEDNCEVSSLAWLSSGGMYVKDASCAAQRAQTWRQQDWHALLLLRAALTGGGSWHPVNHLADAVCVCRVLAVILPPVCAGSMTLIANAQQPPRQLVVPDQYTCNKVRSCIPCSCCACAHAACSLDRVVTSAGAREWRPCSGKCCRSADGPQHRSRAGVQGHAAEAEHVD